MINVSSAFKLQLASDKRNYKVKLKITLADDTILDDITEKDIWTSSFKISDATSGISSFDVGSAIINKLNFAINNIYNTYSTYDFNGAKVVCQVGLTLPDATTEYINKGTFTVYEQPIYNGSLISFVCYDNMYKFDKKITSITGSTMGDVVSNICSALGVSLSTITFSGSTLAITLPSDVAKMTYRQLLSYICMFTGNFARINVDGALEIKWYDTSFFYSEFGFNGGSFNTTTTPYSDGNVADGGNFTDYTSGANVDGGTFTALGSFHHIYSLSSQSFSTDDVIITGIKIIDSDQVEHVTGTSDYMISIENNSLVTNDNVQTYLTFLGNKLIGMRFRKYNVSCLSDPTIESGDNVKVSDNKGNTYLSFVNNSIFTIGDYQTVSCNAESPLQNSSEKNSATTQNIVNARKEAEKQISTYDLYVQQLTSLIANGYGMFPTAITDDNGGIITYLHDKPIMDESSIRWFTTSGGMIEQNRVDGVWVTVSGTDKYGNALYNILTARGINAEWIKVLTSFTVGGLFSVDAIGKLIATDAEFNNVKVNGGNIEMVGVDNSTPLVSASRSYNDGISMVNINNTISPFESVASSVSTDNSTGVVTTSTTTVTPSVVSVQERKSNSNISNYLYIQKDSVSVGTTEDNGGGLISTTTASMGLNGIETRVRMNLVNCPLTVNGNVAVSQNADTFNSTDYLGQWAIDYPNGAIRFQINGISPVGGVPSTAEGFYQLFKTPNRILVKFYSYAGSNDSKCRSIYAADGVNFVWQTDWV